MKTKYILSLLLGITLCFSGCSGFLDQDPDKILTDDQVFGDEVLIKSVLANYYGRINWGQVTTDSYSFTELDEAAKCDGGPDLTTTFSDSQWRVYDYTLLRNINQFLKSIRASTTLDESVRKSYEGEARFIRAWLYFNMCKGLGGMPIVGDEIFEYTPGMDITALQYARSTESELYDYIISECDEIANYLPTAKTTHSARANKWTALMLKARAAIYAASIANYNNKMVNPIKTSGGEVGIPADKAKGYYQTALEAAKAVINSGVYTLQKTKPDDLGTNFYNAVCVKDNNTEVIWARDYYYPGDVVSFTTANIPPSHAEDIDRAYLGPILNLVEAYEYKDNRDGKIKIEENGDYVYYDKPEDAFANKDARLCGTVIYPDAIFKSIPVEMQTGQKVYNGTSYDNNISEPGSTDNEKRVITSINGPTFTNNQFMNKTGFYIRKFLDETPAASTRGRNSDMWLPRFRMSEAYLIACEASFELGNTADAITYINAVRDRAGIQALTSITFDDIVNENRVEFAFENHRYWDLKRWRLADKVWNGVTDDENAQQWGLYPYLVVGGPHDGKWVYEKKACHMSPYPRWFKMQHYYNFLSQSWLDNNPKLVKNPYQ